MSSFHSACKKVRRGLGKRAALKLLRSQEAKVSLVCNDTRIYVSAADAHRLMTHEKMNWTVSQGVVREMRIAMPFWVLKRSNYRSCDSAVIAFHGAQDYKPGVTTAANLGKLDVVAV